MKATDPSGKTYSVTRRWMPWRRRVKGADGVDTGGGFGDLGGLGDDPISLVLFLIFGLIALVLFLPGLLLLIGVAIEVVLLVALLPVAMLGRALFGVPWEIEVRDTSPSSGFVWPVVHTEKVGGWGASGARISDVAHEISRGTFVPTPPTLAGTVTVTRDHLHPTETLRGEDPARSLTLTLPDRDPRLADLVAALKKHGAVAATVRDTPTSWMLRGGGATGPRGRALAAVHSHSGYNSVEIRLAVDPTSRVARGAVFHLDRLLHNEIDSVLDMERHRNGYVAD